MSGGLGEATAQEQRRGRLSPADFAARLQESHRTVWTIAAAVLNDRTLAEDMVQEAATVALGKLDDFDPSTSFVAWFGQIVRYVSLNEGRKRRKVVSGGEDAASVAPINPPAGAGIDDDRLRAALDSLGEVPRLCLVLRTVQGMTFSEIAQALGIPEGTAMSHVHRARAAVRERFGGGGAT